MGRPRRPRASRGRRGPITTFVLLVAGFALAGSTGTLAYFMPALTSAVQATGQAAQLPSPNPSVSTPAAPVPGSAFTVLLLGSDDDDKFVADHILTQSMILVRVDPAARQVTMLSIPRDLYVALSVGGTDKIDTAYAYGGPAAAIATVQENFHVHIDEWVWIGLKGLIKLIDLVGGVDVVATNPIMDDYYPADITGSDPYGFMRIAVLPGAQHLDGVHALQYVRARHSDLRGDFGRSQRQQEVLLALRAKARTLTAADLPDLAVAFQDELRTSMSLPRIRDLVPVAASVKPEDVKQVVLLGDYTTETYVGDADVLLPNWDLILPLVHQSFPG